MIQVCVDLVTGVDLDVDNENHDNQNREDNNSVDVTGQEGCLETTTGGVQDNTPGDQKGCQFVAHTGQGLNGSSTTKQKHGGHNDISAEAEEQEGQMGPFSPTRANNFANGVGRWSNLLEVDGKNSEKQNLNGGARSVP